LLVDDSAGQLPHAGMELLEGGRGGGTGLDLA
jgi:hypothetical protein